MALMMSRKKGGGAVRTIDLGTQTIGVTGTSVTANFTLPTGFEKIVGVYGTGDFDSTHWMHIMKMYDAGADALSYEVTGGVGFTGASISISGTTLTFVVNTSGTVYEGAQVPMHVIIDVI